jgi:hypothetical protein
MKKILPSFLVNFILVEKRLKRLHNINSDFKNTIYIYKPNILSELCEKHGTDKGYVNIDIKKPYDMRPHTYANYYHSIFSLSRESVKYVFECGLGTNNPNIESNMTENGIPGASLRVWKDYFFNAKIFGGDIDKEILFEEDRIKTYYVNQLNSKDIKNMWETIGVKEFDIIIDDGLHKPEANYNFFINSFHKIKKNGVFIIEDVSLKHRDYLLKKLKNYNVEIVIGADNNNRSTGHKYLFVIRNS